MELYLFVFKRRRIVRNNPVLVWDPVCNPAIFNAYLGNNSLDFDLTFNGQTYNLNCYDIGNNTATIKGSAFFIHLRDNFPNCVIKIFSDNNTHTAEIFDINAQGVSPILQQFYRQVMASYNGTGGGTNRRLFIFSATNGTIMNLNPPLQNVGGNINRNVNANQVENNENNPIEEDDIYIDFIDRTPPFDSFIEFCNQNGYNSKNIILYGPPGTGKTFKTRELSQKIVGLSSYEEYSSKNQIVFTTFHQSLAYEDFIEGIKPETNGNVVTYPIKDGIFKKICIVAAARCLNFGSSHFINEDYSNLFTDAKKYEAFKKEVYPEIITYLKDYTNNNIPKTCDHRFVIIIDEINRGNISQIFGELITLIEDDKRGGQDNELRAILPYSGEPFIVPPNVYIIGTMNTADRSAEALDTALRRRFVFIEMPPVYGDLNKVKIKDVSIAGINQTLGDLLKIINDRIFVLKGKDYEIGHSYFLEIAQVPNGNGILKPSVNIQEVNQVIIYKILPLLQEYFYNDFEKIMHVLSDHYSCNPFGEEIRRIDDGFTGLHNISTETDFYEVIRPDENSIQRAIQRIFNR